jgi:hypothetical protein
VGGVTDYPALSGIDIRRPHSARVWNFWLGGKDNYEVDREIGEQVAQVFPGIVKVARDQRRFLGRAVSHLAKDAGIGQFLDIGTGLPTADNTHEVAQREVPAAHIVYVDNDPLVLTHARALLKSTPEGAAHYIEADVRDPARILEQAAGLLDLTRPIALMMLGIMGHVPDDAEAVAIVGHLVDALPSGSHLVLTDGLDTDPDGVESMRQYNASGAVPYTLRGPERIAAFFEHLELLDPGLVPPNRWRSDVTRMPNGAEELPSLCGVARKP